MIIGLFKIIKNDLKFYGGTNPYKVIITFLFRPAFRLMLNYRLGHYLISKNNKFLNLIVSYLKYVQTTKRNCQISYESILGEKITFPHPIGLVIGKNVVIENEVTIYQNVTLGQTKEGLYPLVKKGTVIYPNSVVVGDIVLEQNTVVGALSFINKSTKVNEVIFNKK